MGQNDSVDLLDCNQRGFFFFYMLSELLFLTDVSAFSGVTGTGLTGGNKDGR